MKILDTVTINYILEKDLSLEGDYFVTPDIENEVSVAEIVWNKKIPKNIKSILSKDDFDEASFVKNYFYVLNKYGGRSFFNMTGFGDISLITLAKTLVESKDFNEKQSSLFPWFKQQIEIFTLDRGLKKKVFQEVIIILYFVLMN